MNIERIKELIALFEGSSLSGLEVQEGEFRVNLQRGHLGNHQVAHLQDSAPQTTVQAKPAPVTEAEGLDFNRIIEVTSPVVGVFYEASEPGGRPYVKVGDYVQRGDVLCLIEVMKQVTEVTAPQSGQVADICAINGNVVEFGQVLVKLC